MSYSGVSKHLQKQYDRWQVLDHFIGRKKVFHLWKKKRLQFYEELTKELNQKENGRTLYIDECHDLPAKEFVSKYVKKGKPVLFKGLAKNWGCCQKWSLDYFKELHGDDEIINVANNVGEVPIEKMTLAEIIDQILQGNSKYYRFYPLLKRHPEHIKDFDYNWLRNRRTTNVAEVFQVFIGAAGTETPIHNAGVCNLFVQAYGTKKWMLYPKNMISVIDPEPVVNFHRGAPFRKGEPFNPFNPDYETYPLYEKIDRYEVVLEQGDVLWNPPYMWHTVRNETDAIGVGYRWIDFPLNIRIDPVYGILDLFVKNPPIWKSIKMGKEDYNLVQYMERKEELENFLNSQSS